MYSVVNFLWICYSHHLINSFQKINNNVAGNFLTGIQDEGKTKWFWKFISDFSFYCLSRDSLEACYLDRKEQYFITRKWKYCFVGSFRKKNLLIAFIYLHTFLWEILNNLSFAIGCTSYFFSNTNSVSALILALI